MPAAPSSAVIDPPAQAPPAAACDNCGTELRGRFCHACGQSAEGPTRTLPDAGDRPGVLNVAILAVSAVYLAVALRRVYAQSWLLTTGKTVALFLTYQLLLSLWMISAIGLAFRLLL